MKSRRQQATTCLRAAGKLYPAKNIKTGKHRFPAGTVNSVVTANSVLFRIFRTPIDKPLSLFLDYPETFCHKYEKSHEKQHCFSWLFIRNIFASEREAGISIVSINISGCDSRPPPQGYPRRQAPSDNRASSTPSTRSPTRFPRRKPTRGQSGIL